MTLFNCIDAVSLETSLKRLNKVYTCAYKVPRMTFLWPLKLEVYSYLKTFIYGYISVNSAEGNLLARCITLIKMFYIAFYH
jgi:hypothetical protein